MNPRQLSHELRTAVTADLTRRRWIIGLSLVGAAMGQIVTLYQTGIIGHLPDPPLSLFDSDRVDASDYAYRRLSSPDAPLMLINYGVTAALAAAGGKDRAERQPLLPIALGLKTLIDALGALELGREEWSENKALCAYCQIATLCSLAAAALAIPEARAAIAALRERSS
jgi:hypothetical protein